MAIMQLMKNLKKQIQSILDNYKLGNLTQAELLGKKLITKNPVNNINDILLFLYL